jgi:hypothetical protein
MLTATSPPEGPTQRRTFEIDDGTRGSMRGPWSEGHRCQPSGHAPMTRCLTGPRLMNRRIMGRSQEYQPVRLLVRLAAPSSGTRRATAGPARTKATKFEPADRPSGLPTMVGLDCIGTWDALTTRNFTGELRTTRHQKAFASSRPPFLGPRVFGICRSRTRTSIARPLKHPS